MIILKKFWKYIGEVNKDKWYAHFLYSFFITKFPYEMKRNTNIFSKKPTFYGDPYIVVKLSSIAMQTVSIALKQLVRPLFKKHTMPEIEKK